MGILNEITMSRILLFFVISTLVVVNAYDDFGDVDEFMSMNLRRTTVKHPQSQLTNSPPPVWDETVKSNKKNDPDALRRELLARGEISLDELNAEMDTIEKVSMDFKTVSVTLNISPVETSLEDSEERIRMFERGYLEFLRSVFSSREEGHSPIDVMSVEVVKSQFDEKSSGHSINVECNVATFADKSLSTEDVSNIVVNISDEFSSHIVTIWSDIEETLIGNLKSIKGDDFAEHSMYFRLVQSASVSSPLSSSGEEVLEPSKGPPQVFLYVALSVGCLAATVVGVAKMKGYM